MEPKWYKHNCIGSIFLPFCLCTFSYLQSSALIREWGTEESGDYTHHYFCNVLLQYGVSMLSVAGVVTSLQDNSSLGQKQLNQGRLVSVTDWNSLFLTILVTAIACHNDIYDTWLSGFPTHTKAEAQHHYWFNVLAYNMFWREGEKTHSALEERK